MPDGLTILPSYLSKVSSTYGVSPQPGGSALSFTSIYEQYVLDAAAWAMDRW